MNVRILIPLFAAASGLALGGCKIDNRPLPASSDAASAYDASAPALGPIDPTQVSNGSNGPVIYDGYALAERARAYEQSVYARRPDYAFRYQNEQPYAWGSGDGYSMYAEPVNGGYRDYYYAPGAERPYFVRDNQYGYGYGPDGQLAAVYDAAGALLPSGRFGEVVRTAADYYLRAQTMRRYGLDESYRLPVLDPDWSQRSPAFFTAEQPWISAPDRQVGWRDWRDAHQSEIATYEVEQGHDNGRHLGWYKHRGGDDRFALSYAQAGSYPGDGGHGHWKSSDNHGDNGRGHGDDNAQGDGHGHGEGHGHGHGD